MRVLVIPDIHLKTWIFDRAEKILKDGKYKCQHQNVHLGVRRYERL